MTDHNMNHLAHLEAVAAADVAFVRMREETYRGSWKKRGGTAAFHMLARKWDRLENISSLCVDGYPPGYHVGEYDIFGHIAAQPGGEDGSALAEVRDLRRYLLLVEAEMVARGVVVLENRPVVIEKNIFHNCGEPGREDSNRHAAQEYLMDGWSPPEYNKQRWPCLSVPKHDNLAILDRRRIGLVHTEHLPRLAVELNAKEHEETLPEYRWLYEWDNGKFRMDEVYRELWGKQ